MREHERVRREVEYEEAVVPDPAIEETRPIDYVERRRVVDSEVVEPDYVAPAARVRRDEVVERHFDDPALRRAITFRKISNVVWSLTGLIEALIGLRVLLKLIGANAANGFVDFIYDLSGVFVRPFQGIVNDPVSDQSVLEINSLIAMAVYLILAWAILRLLWMVYDVSEPVGR